MDIEKGNIYNLLNGQCQYIIPVYQRKYSWLAEVHCARLWNDIVKMEKGHKKHHFVGSIVSIAEKKALMGVQKQLIIDGQQRMTTLSILMIALRDFLKETTPKDEYEDDITLEGAISLAITAINDATDHETTSNNVEIAVIKKDDGEYVKLPQDEVQKYIDEVLAKEEEVEEEAEETEEDSEEDE